MYENEKLLAAALAVCMLLTMMPVAAFAEDTITVYFRNKEKRIFNGQEVVLYHHYSDVSGMVSADDIDARIYDDAYYYFDMEPVDSDKEFWVAEIPAKYIGEHISFYNPEKGNSTAYFTVPNKSGLICDLNSEYYDSYDVEDRDRCWVEYEGIESLGAVSVWPAHPEYHVIVSTTEEWDGQEYTYYHCQHCFHEVSSPFDENVLTLEEDEKYLLKNINDKNLLIEVMPGAEIVAGSDFTVGLVINSGTINDSTVNADIINTAYGEVVRQFPILNNVDCGGYNVFNQWYLSEATLGSRLEKIGVVTWDDAKESSLTMKYYIGSSSGPASLEDSTVLKDEMLVPLSWFIGVEGVDVDILPGAEDADSKTWNWPSKEWIEKVQDMNSPRMLSYESEEDGDDWQPLPLFNGFTVPSGYTLSLDKTDITLAKETPKDEPVIEDEEEDTYDIVVRVKFDGVDEDDIDFVNAQLLKNGEAYKKAVKVDENDEWTHRWRDVDDSRKIEWTVTADPIDGYNMDIVHVRANYWTITLSPKNAAAEKVNPSTGADDFVGAAVVLAVCSAACGAVLSIKK